MFEMRGCMFRTGYLESANITNGSTLAESRAESFALMCLLVYWADFINLPEYINLPPNARQSTSSSCPSVHLRVCTLRHSLHFVLAGSGSVLQHYAVAVLPLPLVVGVHVSND
eukprot:1153874-Pelagomonas_calceolata.AAC.2